MSRRLLVRTAAVAVVLLLTACSGGDDEAAPAATASDDAEQDTVERASGLLETIPLPGATATPPAAGAVPAPEQAQPSPPHREVEITSPADGATVSSPVTLEVRVEGFSLAPVDGSFEDDSGHLYAYVDRPLPTAQERFPEDLDVIRFAASTVVLPELAPGKHTIGVIASHGYPVPMMPIVADEVTITVE